jgi:hypothetical protein
LVENLHEVKSKLDKLGELSGQGGCTGLLLGDDSGDIVSGNRESGHFGKGVVGLGKFIDE